MSPRHLPQLESRWQQLNRRMWKEEKAMLAGTITRTEQLELDARGQASRRALEIEAGMHRRLASSALIEAAGRNPSTGSGRSPEFAAEFAAAKAAFSASVDQLVTL